MSDSASRQIDVAIIGAGFAGLYMLHKCRGLGLSAHVWEAGSGVGGTWFWNRYPGARCDAESLQYSYSFVPEIEQEWRWTERYATQPEILAYIEHVADRLDLKRDVTCNTKVTAARYDDAAGLWRVSTDKGEEVTARFVIGATGALSAARIPEFKGLESYTGETYHTGTWPHHKVDFAGKRVGIIGTGSSGVQLIPMLAEEAAHLHVFQRTPAYSIPAHNRPLDDAYVQRWNSNAAEFRRKAREETRNGMLYETTTKSALEVSAEERQREYERRWAIGGGQFLYAYADLLVNPAANETAADFARAQIRSIVTDPKVAALLTPTDYGIGTKRPCVDTDYFATFNRPNVTLVDVNAAPIAEITETGIRLEDGSTYELDAIVFATGFDALTGPMLAIDVTGRSGLSLREKWAEGPRAYLGLMSNGFPNLFTVTGPGSPSVLGNVVVSIEQHVDLIGTILAHMQKAGLTWIEPEKAAEDAWVQRVNEIAAKTLMTKAKSWYMGANIPGKPRVFLAYAGGVDNYRKECDAMVADGFRGFSFAA